MCSFCRLMTQFVVKCVFLCVLQQEENDGFHFFRYLETYDGSLEFNSTTCRELRQEIMDVKVLTMWVFIHDIIMDILLLNYAFILVILGIMRHKRCFYYPKLCSSMHIFVFICMKIKTRYTNYIFMIDLICQTFFDAEINRCFEY